MQTIHEINSIEDIQMLVTSGFREWERYGAVNVSYHDGLVLFDYKAEAQYINRWNFFERVSRGLLIDEKTGEVVARPFDKFFNWGENGRTTSAPLVEVLEKCDGSLGILYRRNGEYRVSTRGSLVSKQALWASRFLNENYDLSGLPENLTLLFEIIYPENRIVVDYQGREDLVLLGVRDRFTGDDYPFAKVREIAERYGFSTPNVFEFERLADVLEAAKYLKGTEAEGWVCRFADGQRFKVKGEDYVNIHRIVWGFTIKHMVEAVYTFDTNRVLSSVPKDFADLYRSWRDEIESTIKKKQAWVEQEVSKLPEFASESERALWLQEKYPHDFDLFFDHLRGKDYVHKILARAYGKKLVHLIPQRQAKLDLIRQVIGVLSGILKMRGA